MFEERYLDEPSNVDFSEVTPSDELIDPIFVESTLNLAPIPPISSLSSSLPILLPSLDPPGSIFVESETYVPDSL